MPTEAPDPSPLPVERLRHALEPFEAVRLAVVFGSAADEAFGRPVEDFDADEKGRDLAIFYLFLAIQECIDIAAHWVTDEGWGTPAEAGEAFDVLARRGVLTRELARSLRAAVGLRNRIAHGDTSIRPERLHAEYTTGREALEGFLPLAADAVGL